MKKRVFLCVIALGLGFSSWARSGFADGGSLGEKARNLLAGVDEAEIGVGKWFTEGYGYKIGAEFRLESMIYASQQRALDLTFGYLTARHNYFGLQAGLGKGSGYLDAYPLNYSFTGMPLVLEYRHHFMLGKRKVNSFVLGLDAGVSIPLKTVVMRNDFQAVSKDKVVDVRGGGTIFHIKAGFDFRVFDRFNAGAYFKLGLLSGGIGVNVYL